MRKRVAPPGRMRAGVRRRCSHASCRCRARPCSCSAMSALAAKNGRARSPAHRRPPSGTFALQRSLGAPCRKRPAATWRCNSRAACRRTCARAERVAHPPQLMVGGRRQGPAQERLAVQGQLCPGDVPWAVLPSEGRCPADQVLSERRLPRPPRRDAWAESHCRWRRQLRQGTAQVLPWVSPLAARRRAPREEGLALPLLSRAGVGVSGREHREVHPVQPLQELVHLPAVRPREQCQG